MSIHDLYINSLKMDLHPSQASKGSPIFPDFPTKASSEFLSFGIQYLRNDDFYMIGCNFIRFDIVSINFIDSYQIWSELMKQYEIIYFWILYMIL